MLLFIGLAAADDPWFEENWVFGGGFSIGGGYDGDLTGRHDGGFDVEYRGARRGGLRSAFRPRVTVAYPWSIVVYPEELTLTFGCPETLATLGVFRPPVGVEAADRWFNALEGPSLLQTEIGPHRVLGHASVVSIDAGWEFAAYGGLDLPEPTIEGSPSEDWTFFPTCADHPAECLVGGTWLHTNQVMFDFRLGGSYRADTRFQGSVSLALYPFDVVSTSFELAALGYTDPGIDAKEAEVRGLAQVELLPHSLIRPAGRFEISYQRRIFETQVVGGIALVTRSAGTNMRLQGLVVHELVRGSTPAGLVDLTMWFGYPTDVEGNNVDPTTHQRFTDPRRTFGEQP